MGSARQHHFQPQFYLKGFADEHEQLRVFDISERREVAKTRVRNVAGHRDLYRFGAEEIESDLARLVDGPAASTIKRLASTFPPAVHDRIEFAHFLAVLYVRNPAFKRLLRDAAGPRYRESFMRWATSLLARTDDEIATVLGAIPEFGLDGAERRELLQLIAAGEYKLAVVDQAAHARALGSPIVPHLAEAISQRAWGLGTAPRGFDFITSDRALAWSSPPGDSARSVFDAAYLQFPVDRRHVLLMAGLAGLPDRQSPYTPELVREANGLTAAMAERYLYAHPDAQVGVFFEALAAAEAGTEPTR